MPRREPDPLPPAVAGVERLRRENEQLREALRRSAWIIPVSCSATAGSRTASLRTPRIRRSAHLLRRCRVLLLDYPEHPFVAAVKTILQAGFGDARSLSAGVVSDHGLAVARGHYLEARQLLQRTPSRRLAVRRFQPHLIVELQAIFSFLFDPTLDATNWHAEHALRPAVVTRKMCGGGNRTRRGADSQQILASVLRTADERGLDATDVLVALLTAPTPAVPTSLRAIPRGTLPAKHRLPNSQFPKRARLGCWMWKWGVCFSDQMFNHEDGKS